MPISFFVKKTFNNRLFQNCICSFSTAQVKEEFFSGMSKDYYNKIDEQHKRSNPLIWKTMEQKVINEFDFDEHLKKKSTLWFNIKRKE